MKRIVFVFAFIVVGCVAALAQSSPNFYQGFVPTSGQWKSYFAAKQDLLGYTAVNRNGDTMYGPLNFAGTAPMLSSCGTGPTVNGNDTTGTITTGTGSPTGCIVTFANSKVSAPHCVVSWRANLAAMAYTTSTTALTITQTGASQNLIDYQCTVSR